MTNQMILTTEMASTSLALVSFVTSLILFKKARSLSRSCSNLESRIEEEITALSTDLDTVSRKSGEHGRRVAWLETKVRSPRSEKKVEVEALASTNPGSTNQKPTITERRHRVLSLARRGQDPQTIARTLGMPHGEVELMINLGRAA